MKVLPEAKSQTAMYCEGAGVVAEVIGVDCIGWTHVKGDGILPEGDKYGETYRRPCPRAADCDGVVCRTAI